MTGLGWGYDPAGALQGGFRPQCRVRALWQPYGKEEVARGLCLQPDEMSNSQLNSALRSARVHWLSWPGGSSSSGHERSYTHRHRSTCAGGVTTSLPKVTVALEPNTVLTPYAYTCRLTQSLTYKTGSWKERGYLDWQAHMRAYGCLFI